MIQHQRNINMYPGVRAPERIHLSQYDSDFTLVFSLYSSAGSFSIESGTTAMIRGTKGDGNGYSASVSLSGTTVTVQGNNQMTAVAGPNTCELVLTRSGKVLSTANFILDVEPAAMDADTIQSETVLRELNAIIEGAETATQAAENAADAADRAEEAARTLTIDNTLTQAGQAADAKKVGDEITDLKEDLQSVETDLEPIKDAIYTAGDEITFPTSYSGDALVSGLSGKILTGGRNLAKYIGFVDGTYSLNGITCIVSGNVITINGTASAAVYLAPHLGTITGNADGLNVETDYNLPAIEYRFGADWSNIPADVRLSIRSRASGNVDGTTASNAYKDLTYDHSTCGEIYIYIKSGVTVTNGTITFGIVPTSISNAHSYFSEFGTIREITSDGLAELSTYSLKLGTATVSEIKIETDTLGERRYFKTAAQFIEGAALYECLYGSVTTGSSSKINLTQDSNRTYNSYVYTFPEGTSLYFGDLTGCSYLSLCIGENPSSITPDTGTGNVKYYIPCDNPVRIRKTSSEDTLPHGEVNAIDVGGKVVVISTDNASQDFGFYVKGMSYDKYIPIALSKLGDSRSYPVTQKALKEILSMPQKLCYLQFDDSDGTDKLFIWIPTGGRRYVKYVFEHTILAAKNADVWRIDRAYMCLRDLSEATLLTEGGEWECALRLSGRDDFSGGKAHGDEICEKVTFVLDGVTVGDISTLTDVTPFHNLTILQTSVLYDPDDSTTEIATHASEHVFTHDRNQVAIRQTIQWLDNFDIATCYLAMFPVSKDVTSEWYNDLTFDRDTIELGSYYNISEVNMFSSDSHIVSRFGVSKYIKDASYSKNGRFMISDNSGLNYNKSYYTISSGENVSAKAGEVTADTIWQTESYYNFDYC